MEQGFLKKYISHCKYNIHPELTDSSVNLLSELWALLRQRDQHEKSTSMKKVLPITIRSFETLIRLSTAHAKLHMSNRIEVRDCVEAFRLMSYCLEGDSFALDSDLRDVMKKLRLDDPSFFEKGEERSRPQKNVVKKEVKKMEEDIKGIVRKVDKIDINRDEKEAEIVIKRAMNQP